jgi:hypothetical protein
MQCGTDTTTLIVTFLSIRHRSAVARVCRTINRQVTYERDRHRDEYARVRVHTLVNTCVARSELRPGSYLLSTSTWARNSAVLYVAHCFNVDPDILHEILEDNDVPVVFLGRRKFILALIKAVETF